MAHPAQERQYRQYTPYPSHAPDQHPPLHLSHISRVDRAVYFLRSRGAQVVVLALVANTMVAQLLYNSAGQLVLGNQLLLAYLLFSAVCSTVAFALFEISTIFQLQARDAPAGPDLRSEILALVDEMTDMLGFAPSLRLGARLGGDISPVVAEQALAALREALSNAARHAQASQVDVTVDVDADEMLVVRVTDDGTGIPAGGRRSGLHNMASRAEKLGGELRLEPADPGAPAPGTRLEWRVPVG